MDIVEYWVEDDREEHLARHGVSLDEAEQVVFGRPIVLKSRDGNLKLIGRTDAGRLLVVVLGASAPRVFGLITARDVDAKERRLYLRRGGR